MKPIVVNMDKMSDSREVYESKPGKAGVIFIYTVFVLAVVGIIWMQVGKIDEVVKSDVIVRPNENISTVINQTAGEIQEVNVTDGVAVHQGDCLYKINCLEQEKQKQYLEKQIEEENEKLSHLKKYKRSVQTDKNRFKAKGNEEQYYIRFESYYINYQNAIHESDFEIDSNKYQLQSSKKQLLSKSNKLSNYKKLRNCIEKSKNKFENYGADAFYSDMYCQYISGYQKIKEQYDAKTKEIERSSTIDGLVDSIGYYKEQKKGYETLLKSVDSDKNCFKEESSYKLKYEQYENKMEQLADEYEATLEEYNLNFDLQDYGISESELALSEKKMNDAKQAIKDYKIAYRAEIKQDITDVNKNLSDYRNQKTGQLSKKTLLNENKKQKEHDLKAYAAEYKVNLDNIILELTDAIDGLEDNIKSLQLQQNKKFIYSGKSDASVCSLKINELKTTINEMDNCHKQIREYENQLKTIQFQIDNASVTASIDGTVNSNMELVRGDILSAGAQVMTIIPMGNSTFKANIYVGDSGIAKLKVGMPIKFNIYALPTAQYGYFTGVIESISEDIKVDAASNTRYYLVEASIDSKQKYDKDGERVQLKSGMAGQAKMITGEKSIFQFVMEKLNLWINS